jgi:PAS domain S-box-containing protein
LATAEPISAQQDHLNRKLLRVMIVEDSVIDAELVERQLRKAGYDVAALRVDSAAAFAEALATGAWDVIVADYAIPGFGAVPALERLKRSKCDIPFIIVSGAITDEIAVASMRAGAHDYVLKDNIARLVPAIERELKEAASRQQKREAETAVRRLSAIVESSDDAIIGKNLEGIITSWNRRAENLYGYTAAEMLGRSMSILMPSDSQNELPDILRRLAGGESIQQYETRRRRKNGTVVDVALTISPILDPDGKLIGASSIARDITKRKRVEEAIERSARHTQRVLDSLTALVGVLSLDGTLLEANKAALDLAGVAAYEVIGKPFWETRWWRYDPEVQRQVREAITRAALGQAVRYDVAHPTPEGAMVTVDFTLTPMRDDQGQITHLIASAVDISARKQAEQALIRSEKLASVGRMAATIAHEINNPLASAMNLLFLASLDPALSESARKKLELAESELGRVAHITKQTLGFYRESGTPTGLDVPEIVNGVLDVYGSKLKNKSVSIQRRFRSTGPIQAIEGELRQVVSNLVANSIDAINGTGVLHVRTCGPRPGDGKRSMVRLTVADNGVGISSENLKRIFEPFFTTKVAIGTGLGLWVTSELVKKHEGRIRVRSRLGKGTVFSIWLPTERRQQERDAASGAKN